MVHQNCLLLKFSSIRSWGAQHYDLLIQLSMSEAIKHRLLYVLDTAFLFPRLDSMSVCLTKPLFTIQERERIYILILLITLVLFVNCFLIIIFFSNIPCIISFEQIKYYTIKCSFPTEEEKNYDVLGQISRKQSNIQLLRPSFSPPCSPFSFLPQSILFSFSLFPLYILFLPTR